MLELPAIVLVDGIVLNGLVALVSGERYMRDGLVAAMGVHFWADIVWKAQALPPDDVAGTSGRTYKAGDWEIGIVFSLVNPSKTVYRVLIANHATSFSWEGQLSADGQITELTAAA